TFCVSARRERWLRSEVSPQCSSIREARSAYPPKPPAACNVAGLSSIVADKAHRIAGFEACVPGNGHHLPTTRAEAREACMCDEAAIVLARERAHAHALQLNTV